MSNYTSVYTGAQIDNAVALRTIIGSTAPTTATVGIVGQRYFDTISELEYKCTEVAGGIYTWKLSDTVTTVNGKAGEVLKSDIVALGIPAQDTTYPNATTIDSGLMSNEDKIKLNSIAENADVSVNPDWNASSGKAQIKNKPTLSAVATTGSYSDLSNKPTIPTVPVIVNSLTEAIEGKTLDATQGKILNESKVPKTLKVNGKALSQDISLSASDVSADALGTASTAVSTHDSNASAHSTKFDEKLDKSGGTMTGNLYSNNPSPETVAVRNMYAGTTDMVAGTTALPTGVFYAMYE